MNMILKSLSLLFSAAAMLSTAGCMPVFTAFNHADQYTAGDFSTDIAVKALDIDWTAGSVTVSRHDDPELTVTETCSTSLKDSQKVQTWLEGSTLHIRYCKPNVNFNLSAEKKLEIKLPNNLDLDTLKCDCTSAETNLTDISADSFEVDVTSGTLQLSDCSAGHFDIGSTSGDITVAQKGNSEKLNAESTSGKIQITAETVKELKAHSTSGDVSVTAQKTESVSAESTSGSETLHFIAMPASADICATSGNVSIFVPKKADFTASVDTTTGSFDSDISLTKNGDTYTAGSGANQIRIDTTSGDVAIKAEG